MQQRIRNPITAPRPASNVVDMRTYHRKGTSTPAPAPASTKDMAQVIDDVAFHLLMAARALKSAPERIR